MAGFRIGDEIKFIKNGQSYMGVIIALDDAKKKAVIEYVDDEGNEQLEKTGLKNLSRE